MSAFEHVVEEAAVDYFRELGYEYAPHGEIAPDGLRPERSSYNEVILEERLRRAVARLNPHLPKEALDDVVRQVLHLGSPSLEENNYAFHRLLTEGVGVRVRRNGTERDDLAWLVDFEDAERNDWLVVNQFTVTEGQKTRRPDVVVFLNGLPIAVLELKNPEDEDADLESAYNQFQTYKDEIPSLFYTNELLVISDGSEARVGSLTAPLQRLGPWRSLDGEKTAPTAMPEMRVVIEGLFRKERLLDYLRHFILWETEDGYVKKCAYYHQYFAANKAVESTVEASRPSEDGRIGVVWHTQGSGKSISMVFYTSKIIDHAAMENPTVVVLTDRNDLDGQLYGQFAAAKGLLPSPVQAESREHLRELLSVASGGIVFTTIQKFGTPTGERMPCLSDRHNIVVIADEAHRSQYEFIDGFARNLRDALPNASFIGFTGTPIELSDRSTPAVFGNYIDTYTISRAVEDGATVPIHYEARLAKLDLPEEAKARVDDEFEEVTEGEEDRVREKLKTTWAKLEALAGTERRLQVVARDILAHWDRRTEILPGKAMIVGMSRKICVDLYEAITRRRPRWHADDDAAGRIKVVMTGAASDPANYQPHIRTKSEQKEVERRFKDPDDPLEIVIVCDMWLTGFDVPCAHTLYLDKPMKGHTLMQAIARVNRVYGEKPSGLVVDYMGIATQLRKAVHTYGGQKPERPGVPVEEALQVLKEKFDVVRSMLHGYDYSPYFDSSATERLEALTGAADHILGLEDGKERYLDAMASLNKASAMAIHLEEARDLRDEVGFFQAVQKNLRKYTISKGGKTKSELNESIRQIVSDAVTPGEVVDIFGAAGIAKPDISILSEDFLETVQANPHKNLQIELLRKLINDEIKSQRRKNVVQARRFSEMLERTVLSYQNRSLEAGEVILELIEMARKLRDEPSRAEKLGLTEDELAFYDALIDHGNVREVMDDDVLGAIAHDLVEAIRGSVTIDWTQKKAVRAKMRAKIKRLLRRHGYPPDKRKEALQTVIQQAEQVCRDWAVAT